jgi:HK97 family phage prohead protease
MVMPERSVQQAQDGSQGTDRVSCSTPAGASPELAQQDTFTYIASTGGVDRAGDIIDPSGWQLDRYRQNPVVLFAHHWHMPPIGKAEKVWVQENKLMAIVRYADTPLGREVARLNAEGYMAAVSVGFIPLEWEPRINSRTGFPMGLHCHRQELLEISAVPIPANPEAVRKGHGALHRRDAGPPYSPPLVRGDTEGSPLCALCVSAVNQDPVARSPTTATPIWLTELGYGHPIEYRPTGVQLVLAALSHLHRELVAG